MNNNTKNNTKTKIIILSAVLCIVGSQLPQVQAALCRTPPSSAEQRAFGDVNDDGDVNMADVMTLWYDIADYSTPGAYEVDCC